MQKSNFILVTDESHRAVMAQSLANALHKIAYTEKIIISCGLETVDKAIAEKHKNGGVLVSILDPQKKHDEFDFIFVPSHDPSPDLPNIYKTHGLLTNIKSQDLLPDGRFDYLPMPRVAVLIGGKHVGGNFGSEDAENLARFLNSKNISVMLTTSRRTEILATHRLKEKINRPHFIYDFNYDGQDNNPYMQMLAVADEIIVSADSARMVSESVSSGRNVNIFYPQDLHFSYKALADNLIHNGYANNMKNFGNPTLLLNEAERCACIIAAQK